MMGVRFLILYLIDMKDAVRFAYKVYAQCAGKNLGDRQFFIDADCIFLSKIPMDWYDNFIDDKDFSYYPRPSYYTETGFVTYNCKSEVVHKFFDKFQEIYDTGKIFDYEQQNDSYIFDRVMEMFLKQLQIFMVVEILLMIMNSIDMLWQDVPS